MITANGDTEISNALEVALEELAGAPEQLRHIVLFTDGWDPSDANLLPIAREIADAGVTLSVLGTGEGPGTTLERMAELGGGRYYAGDNLEEIPEIFVQETLTVARNLATEGTFFPVLGAPSTGHHRPHRVTAAARVCADQGQGDGVGLDGNRPGRSLARDLAARVGTGHRLDLGRDGSLARPNGSTGRAIPTSGVEWFATSSPPVATTRPTPSSRTDSSRFATPQPAPISTAPPPPGFATPTVSCRSFPSLESRKPSFPVARPWARPAPTGWP